MQVRAATSVAILRDGALWGLIACHHRSARPVAPDQRAALELLGVVLAAHLGEVESRHATTRLARSVAALEQICERLRAARSLRVGLLEQMAPLMALFEADGAVLQLDRQLDRRGAVPSRPEVMALLELVLQGQQELFATDCLAAHLADARSHAQIAAGLLALRISREAGDCLLLFRREWARTVAWAGDPGSAIEFDADGRQYHPRRSFRIWQESVTERSRPWDEVTLDTGRRLRQRLLELALYAQEMRVRALSGMFPICAWCKKVRGHDDQWYSVDAYLMRHTDAVVTHSMCPACLDAFA
jgi:light-regulated signal transduction histidine kinase (bacteriophytochrome)